MYTSLFLLRISNLNSTESEVDIRRPLFLGRLITEQKMSPTVRHLFRTRTDSFFDADPASLGFIPRIYETLNKYDLLHFQLWFSESIFPCYENWKVIVRTKIREKENTIWQAFCTHHSAMQIAQVCLENVSPHQFWSITNNFLDLVSRLHVQIRLMGNCGLNSGIPRLSNTDGVHCFPFLQGEY